MVNMKEKWRTLEDESSGNKFQFPAVDQGL